MASTLYKDIAISFKAHPITGDLLTLNDEESIKQSVKTLILTSVYERVMHPEKGSQVIGLLFENESIQTRIMIRDTITSVLKQYEPRIQVRNISIDDTIDGNYDINLTYAIIDFQIKSSVQLLLSRVR